MSENTFRLFRIFFLNKVTLNVVVVIRAVLISAPLVLQGNKNRNKLN